MKHLLLTTIILLQLIQVHATRIESSQNGSFLAGSSWAGGVVPGINDTAVIKNSHTINMIYGQSVSVRALTVLQGGTYYASGGSIAVEDSINNKGTILLQSTGVITVNGLAGKGITNSGYMQIGYGTYVSIGQNYLCNRKFENTGDLLVNPNSVTKIYGRFFMPVGTLIQDGGDMYFYGNSGTAATSVAETENIAYINATGLNCTEGSMSIVDPHHSSMFTFVNDVEIVGNNPTAFSINHTFYVGDGGSTKPAHPNRGIMIGNGSIGGDKAPINNLTVISGGIKERAFITSIISNGGTYIKGDVSVKANSEFQHRWTLKPECAIGGNITIDPGCYFTAAQKIILGAASGYSVSRKQIVSGAETAFRNDDVGTPPFNFNSLEFNNQHADTAIIFLLPNVKVTGDVIFRKGVVACQNFFQQGNSTTPGGKAIYFDGGIINQPTFATLYRRYMDPVATPNALFNSGYDAFPWAGEDFKSRLMRIEMGTITTAGYVDTKHSGGPTGGGVQDVPPAAIGTDNSVVVNVSSKYSWEIGYEGPFVANNIKVQCYGSNMLLDADNGNDIRLWRANFAVADTSIGGGTADAPTGTKTNIPNQMYVWGVYRLAGNSNVLLTKIPSITNGNADSADTWKRGKVPNNAYGAIIKAGHTVNFNNATPRSIKGVYVEQGATLNINTSAGSNFSASDKSKIYGILNINSGFQDLFNSPSPNDTALYIAPTGIVNLNGKATNLYAIVSSSDNRNAFVVNEGTLNINEGKFEVFGALHHVGAANFFMGKGTILNVLGSNGNISSSTTKTLLNFSNTGTVTAEGGEIKFSDPGINANQLTLNINRNTASNFDLRKVKFHFSYNSNWGGGAFAGAANTGFKVETKAGTVNIALGKIFINSNAGVASNRFVRNGDNGFFAGDSLSIASGSRLWLFNTGQNMFAGNILNNGSMVSEAKITFGGTATYPAADFIKITGSNAANFANLGTSPTANFNEIEINHAGQHVNLPLATVIANKLTLTKGFLFPTDNLTLGTSTTNIGELVVTGGRILATSNSTVSHFYRWFNTTTLPAGNTAGLFPFSIGEYDRYIYISGTPSAGGMVGFRHITAIGADTYSPISDAGVTLQTSFSASWVGFAQNGFASTAMGIKIVGGGMQVLDSLSTRMVSFDNQLLSPSVHLLSSGTKTIPVVERVQINSGQLSSGFKIATVLNGTVSNIETVQSGNWDSTSTWSCNCIPLSTSRVTINIGHTVRLNNPNIKSTCRSLRLLAGSVLDIGQDTLLAEDYEHMPDATSEIKLNGGVLDFRVLSNGFTWGFPNKFTINSGTFNFLSRAKNAAFPYLNNVILFTTGSQFNMSGGTVNFNGAVEFDVNNKANVTGGTINILGALPNNTIANYTGINPLFLIRTTTDLSLTKNFTGGDIYIINPHPVAFRPSFQIIKSGLNVPVNMTGSNLHLGKAGYNVENQSGTVNHGFLLSSDHLLGHVFAEGGEAMDGRHATMGSNQYVTIGGNLTILPNGEWRNNPNLNYGSALNLGGNLVNNGTMTSYVTSLVMGGQNNLVVTPQSIGGNGRFRYDHFTANIQSYEPWIDALTVDNYSSQGVTLNRNFKLSRLTMQNGDIHVDSIQLGYNDFNKGLITANGTGAVIGKFNKWVAAGTDTFNIPIGVAGIRRNLRLEFTQGPVTGGLITTAFVPQPGGNSGLPLQEGATSLTTSGIDGYWSINNTSNLTGFNYNIAVSASVFTGVNDYTKLSVLKRVNTASAWTLQGTHVTATGTNSFPTLRRNNLNSFSDFGVGMPNISLPLTTNWTGNISTEWENSGNWSSGVPGAVTEVIIPSFMPRYPRVSYNTTIKNLSAYSGSSVTIGAGVNFKILTAQ